jgi:hypothetical protein
VDIVSRMGIAARLFCRAVVSACLLKIDLDLIFLVKTFFLCSIFVMNLFFDLPN